MPYVRHQFFLRSNFAPLRLFVTLIFPLRLRRSGYFHADTLRRKDYKDCKQPCNAPCGLFPEGKILVTPPKKAS